MLNKNNNKNMLNKIKNMYIQYLVNNSVLYEHNKQTMFNFVKVTCDMCRGGFYTFYSNYFSLLKVCICNYLLQLLVKSNYKKYSDYEFNSCEYNCYNSNEFVVCITEENSYVFTLFNTKHIFSDC